jgi:hypothetical protein
VFYCGMPVLAKELKKLSLELSHKTTTRFEFHKEYFWKLKCICLFFCNYHHLNNSKGKLWNIWVIIVGKLHVILVCRVQIQYKEPNIITEKYTKISVSSKHPAWLFYTNQIPVAAFHCLFNLYSGSTFGPECHLYSLTIDFFSFYLLFIYIH